MSQSFLVNNAPCVSRISAAHRLLHKDIKKAGAARGEATLKGDAQSTDYCRNIYNLNDGARVRITDMCVSVCVCPRSTVNDAAPQPQLLPPTYLASPQVHIKHSQRTQSSVGNHLLDAGREFSSSPGSPPVIHLPLLSSSTTLFPTSPPPPPPPLPVSTSPSSLPPPP